jgi:hypothetical protein
MGLKYSFPMHLKITHECRDLFNKIFVVDPSQRITIAGIKAHPWFLKNLPADYRVGWVASGPLVLCTKYLCCGMPDVRDGMTGPGTGEAGQDLVACKLDTA